MSLRATIDSDLKDAMRSGDTVRRDALRLLLAAIKNAEIAAGGERGNMDDAGVLDVLSRELKQRRDSIAEFEKAGRADLVLKEQQEIDVFAVYLPPPAGADEIRERARAIIAETGAAGPRDMGKVMPRLTSEFKGRADGREMSGIVQELLAAP